MKFIYIIIVFILCSAKGFSQERIPEVGKTMPYFELDNVHHFKNRLIKSDELKGKWVFLDFWFIGCAACIASFPEVNNFQSKFKDKIQYLLVGINDKHNKGIEQVYERFRKKFNLDLAIAYDSVLVKKWKFSSMPHIYIINPEGVLHAVTDGRDLTAEKIQQLIDGKQPAIYNKLKEKRFFDDFTILDTNRVYESKLYKYEDEIGTYAPIDAYLKTKISNTPTRGYGIACAPLKSLYFISTFGFNPTYLKSSDSLYGRVSPLPILEVKDSSLFVIQKPIVDGAKGYYNYSVKIQRSKASKEYLMHVMQNDLKNNFGFDVRVEKREVPVWKLISNDTQSIQLLKSKGGEEGADTFDFTGISFGNKPIKNLLLSLRYYLAYQEIPIFDETGIMDNVDMDIHANMQNVEEIRKALKKYKLDLVKGTQQMECLVIADPKYIKTNSAQVLQTN